MVANLEPRSVIKFLLAEKCKSCAIYERIWVVKRNFTNELNKKFPSSLSRKDTRSNRNILTLR